MANSPFGGSELETLWQPKIFESKKLLAVAALFLVTAAGLSYYLANLPRERVQRNDTFLERLDLGAKSAWKAIIAYNTRSSDPGAASQIPQVNIAIPDLKIDDLKSNLPLSGQEIKIGKANVDGKWRPAEIRFNGISVNHFALPLRSWNVRFLDDGTFKGIKGFALIASRERSQFENWIGNELARRMGGLLVPDSEFIRLKINGKFDGLRLLQEGIRQPFLKRRNLPPGKIFYGDITTAQVYGRDPREKLFSDIRGWEAVSPEGWDSSTGEVSRIIDVVQNETDPKRFAARMKDLFEMDALIRYMAVLEIMGSVHIDETHNWKLYLNPKTNKFSPIVFNTVGYFWGLSKNIDFAPSELFRSVILNPEFREEKDRRIWEATSGPLASDTVVKMIQSEFERIKRDTFATPLKFYANDRGVFYMTNEEWLKAVENLKSVAAERNSKLRKALVRARGEWNLFKSKGLGSNERILSVAVNSRAGISLESVTFKVGEGVERATITPLDAKTSASFAAEEKGGKVSFNQLYRFYSHRERTKEKTFNVVPGVYRFKVTFQGILQGEPAVSEITGRNSVTGGDAELRYNKDLTPTESTGYLKVT